jgi:O-antigen/teichoic acid export membrane protein
MRLSTKIAYNTIIQVASKLIATALALVAVAIITRHLGQHGFGAYTTVLTFLSFFAIAADLGLTLVTVQVISQPGENEEKALANLFALRLVSAFLLLGLAPVAVLFFPYSTTIKLGVLIGTLSFLCVALNQVLVGLFQKKLRMDKVSIAEITGRVVVVAGVAWMAWAQWGLLAAVWATVAGNVISCALHFLFARRFVRLRLEFDMAYWRKIIIRSWPLALTIIFNLIYLRTDTLLLSVINRPTDIGIINEVGLYGAAYKVIDVVVSISFIFAGIVLPIMTARFAAADRAGFYRIIQKAFNVMAILAIPLFVGTQFVAQDIMTLIAGPEFAGSGPILQVLIGAAALIFLGNIFAHAVIAAEKQKKIIWLYLFTAITSFAAYFILIPIYSYMAAAWITIYSELMVAFGSLAYVWYYTGFLPNLSVPVKSLLASGVMAAGILGLRQIGLGSLFLELPLAVIIYFASLYVLGGVTKQEFSDLLNK